MRVKFESVAIEEAHTADEAYDGLGQVLAGILPVLVTREAGEIGYEIRSERALAVASLRGMTVAPKSAVRKMGLGRQHEATRLHADGFVRPESLVVHHHETIELQQGATAQCTLVQAKRDLFSPNQYRSTDIRWGSYLNLAEGDLDLEMLYPVVYQAELNQGDAVDFCASGPVTMVHLFTADPSYSDRTIAVTRIL